LENQTVTSVDDMLKNCLAQVALNYVGIKEQGGNNMGQMVERFQRAVDNVAMGEPWCLSFIWYAIFETERLIEAILGRPLDYKARLLMTEHVQTMFNKSPEEQRIFKPEKGSLILWKYYDSSGKPTTSGHIGICTQVNDVDGHICQTVEANTSQGAVSLRTRNIKYRYGRMLPMGILSVW